MKHKIINLKENTVLGVVGDIHEHEPQFDSIVEKFGPSENRLLISVGDVYDKGFGIDKAESIIRKLKTYHNKGFSHTLVGNHDFKHARNAIRNGTDMSPELKWINDQPWSILFKYPNRRSILVIHGGVSPKHTWKDLESSDVMYVKTVDESGNIVPVKKKIINGKKEWIPVRPGKTWHEAYDGRFGYICSGHDAQKDGVPKYYKYSCNIDTAVPNTGILTCQTFDQKGLLDKIQAKDISFQSV